MKEWKQSSVQRIIKIDKIIYTNKVYEIRNKIMTLYMQNMLIVMTVMIVMIVLIVMIMMIMTILVIRIIGL